MANHASSNELVLEPRISNLTDCDSDYDELPSPDIEVDEVDDDISQEGQRIGFCKVHSSPMAFKDPMQNMLIPGVPLNLKIVDVERTPATHMLNPNIYVIHLQHGPYEWVVKKRYKHFQHLHQQLRIFRASLAIPFPTKRHKARRKSCQKADRRQLPRFPQRPEALLSHDKAKRRAQQLEDYLKNVLQIPLYRNHSEMMEFLEISPLSFVEGLGKKYKEGVIQKRSGGHRVSIGCFRLRRGLIDWCGHWRWRWLVVKDTWVAYIKPKGGRVRCVLLMDKGFQIDCGFLATGIHHGLQISNLARHLLIRCWTHRKAREWMQSLVDAAKSTGRDFIQPNRYESFVPVRNNAHCRWFVDGATFFEAVADALEQAKEEIFIADWWLSPELYMKRPVIQGEIWRLDHILKRKAEQGVQIFVLLYKEVELALGINSLYSKQKLVSMHPNIKVLRHPDHVAGGTLLWAHHEKIICVDQTYAFIGGIDLCYGRWDDYQHRLTDLGGIAKSRGEESGDIKNSLAPKRTPLLKRSHSTSDIATGADNSGYIAEQQLPSIQITSIDTESINPDNPACEVSSALQQLSYPGGKSHGNEILFNAWKALDNDETVKRKYNFSKKMKAKRVMQAVVRLQALKRKSHNKSLDSLPSGGDCLDLPTTNLRRTASEIALSELGLEGDAKMWIGKDYMNFIVKDFENLNKPYQDLVDRHITPRMPWHDIGFFVQGACARDVARHFIQRWNFTKFEKAKYYDRYPWLIPKSYENCDDIRTLHLSTTCKLFCANCQVLRSVSTWSAGIKTLEQSIHFAYIDAINNSEHYIYIENQFFISQMAGHKDVFNEISEALYQRIVRAHRAEQTFRVYVVMPLLPAFEGEIGTGTGTAIQAITHWNYASMCRGPGSLWQRLSFEVGDPRKYITFFGLRNYGLLNEKFVTELVYVHSKLMIVDDRLAIIGSANINDRSMLGNRDSEIAILVNDVDFEQSVMNGEVYEVGQFAGSLRRTLFREHLGLINAEDSEIDIRDPVCEQFYKEVWVKAAALNTSIYEKVFRCIPTDEVHTFTELHEYLATPGLSVTEPETVKDLLSGIQGHLVLMPLHFLSKENLMPAAGTKESFMPVCLWT